MKSFLFLGIVAILLSCTSKPDVALCPGLSESSQILGFWKKGKEIGEWQQFDWASDLLLIARNQTGCSFWGFAHADKEPLVSGKWLLLDDEVLFETDQAKKSQALFDSPFSGRLLFRQPVDKSALLEYRSTDCNERCQKFR